MSEPQVVFITGTRKGIGKALAEHFAKNGAIVVGCSRKPVEWDLQNYSHHIADVADEAQVKQIISTIQKTHGRLDIVINNAGIASMNHSLLTPGTMVDRVMQTNLRGVFLVCRESAKVMRKRKYGRIINFSTIAVPMNLEGEAIYASSKSAVETLTRVLAKEFAPYGITCNLVGPTPIDTDLIRAVPKHKIDALIESMPIKRLGLFADVINVIDFFVKPESSYITGQTLYLGGVS